MPWWSFWRNIYFYILWQFSMLSTWVLEPPWLVYFLPEGAAISDDPSCSVPQSHYRTPQLDLSKTDEEHGLTPMTLEQGVHQKSKNQQYQINQFNTMLPCFTVGMLFSEWWTMLGFHQTQHFVPTSTCLIRLENICLPV